METTTAPTAGLIGRDRELSDLTALATTARITVLHGPVGSGKTALLDALARALADTGRTVTRVAATSRSVPRVLGGSVDESEVVLVDDVVWPEAGEHDALDAVLGGLPSSAHVVLASRRPPTALLTTNTRWPTVRRLGLQPLPPAASATLLARLGVVDPHARRELAIWADGSPLALVLGARHHLHDPTWRPVHRALEPWAAAGLGVEDLLEQSPSGLLALASLARRVTVPLVEALLPELPADRAVQWLSQRTFVDAYADGLALQPAMRLAVRARVRTLAPQFERALRRGLADYFHAQATAGATRRTLDLAELIDGATRTLYGPAGSRQRADRLRRGDADVIATRLWAQGRGALWPSVSPLLEHAEEWVTVVRDADDELSALAIATTVDCPPVAAEHDPVLSRWLAHARAAGATNAVVWHSCFDLRASGEPSVLGLLNTSVILRSRLHNPRFFYLPVIDGDHDAHHAVELAGARPVPELDVTVGDRRVTCHLLDLGPGGLLGTQRDLVYREIGLDVPATSTADVRAVRDALRSYHDDAALAASPMAEGATPEQRAAAVRAKLHRSWGAAFGSSDRQQLLAEVVRRAYFERRSSHDATAHDMGLPRQTYFRSLRLAVEAMTRVFHDDDGHHRDAGERHRRAS